MIPKKAKATHILISHLPIFTSLAIYIILARHIDIIESKEQKEKGTIIDLSITDFK